MKKRPKQSLRRENYENTEETDDSSLDEIARRAAETYNISNQAQTEASADPEADLKKKKTETLTKQEIKEAEKGVEKEIEKSEKTPVKYNYPTIDSFENACQNQNELSDMKATRRN